MQEKRFTNLEKNAKIASIKLDLKNHEGIRLILEEIEREISSINLKLLVKKDLTEIERAELFAERSCWLWFVRIFPQSEQILERIKKIIEKYE